MAFYKTNGDRNCKKFDTNVFLWQPYWSLLKDTAIRSAAVQINDTWILIGSAAVRSGLWILIGIAALRSGRWFPSSHSCENSDPLRRIFCCCSYFIRGCEI